MKNIGQAAQLTGFSQRMLRYFDGQGLLSPKRTEGGNRLYGEEEIARALRIRQLRDLGFSYSEVGKILAAPPEELSARGVDLLEHHRAAAVDLLEKIQKLEVLCYGETRTESLGPSVPAKASLATSRVAYSLNGADDVGRAFAAKTSWSETNYTYWTFASLFPELRPRHEAFRAFEVLDQSAFVAVLKGQERMADYAEAWAGAAALELGPREVGEFEIEDLTEFFGKNEIVIEVGFGTLEQDPDFHAVLPYSSLLAKLGKRARLGGRRSTGD